jgi:hypothetical protein
MPDKPNKIFDRPLRNLSENATDERVLEAIKLAKTRLNLWACSAEHESGKKGIVNLSI